MVVCRARACWSTEWGGGGAQGGGGLCVRRRSVLLGRRWGAAGVASGVADAAIAGWPPRGVESEGKSCRVHCVASRGLASRSLESVGVPDDFYGERSQRTIVPFGPSSCFISNSAALFCIPFPPNRKLPGGEAGVPGSDSGEAAGRDDDTRRGQWEGLQDPHRALDSVGAFCLQLHYIIIGGH